MAGWNPFRIVGLICAALLIAGCTPRGAITLDANAGSIGSPEPMFVASSRMPDAEGPGFTRDAAQGLNFGRATVSVPPDRAPGTVTFPSGGRANPQTDFLTIDSARIANPAAFIRDINAALARQPADQREIMVFVHGFNTNFAEGLYRQAQMRHDFKSPGLSLNYSWPSAANVRAYATDREAVLQARDDLEQLIDILTRTNTSRIILTGHSMGAFLVMEAMRQKAIRDAPGAFRKLQTVVLIAPDIDIAVFRRQARALEGHGVSIYVFSSSRDRALRVSAALRGTGERLGSISDVAAISDLPVTVIDLSDVASGDDALGHFKVATSPVMIALIQGLRSYGTEILHDTAKKPGVLEAGVAVMQDVASAALQPLADR